MLFDTNCCIIVAGSKSSQVTLIELIHKGKEVTIATNQQLRQTAVNIKKAYSIDEIIKGRLRTRLMNSLK